MKRKLLCGACIALILSLSLCILAAATRMNRDTPMDSTSQVPEEFPILDGTMGNNTPVLPDGNVGNNDSILPDTNTGNGTTNDTNKNDNMMNDGVGTTDSMPMADELLPETNVPDANIGGAVADNDGDAVPNSVDSDDDNDGVRDPVDSDANGDGVNDQEKTTGIVGIILAVIVVAAVIIVIIAVVPKKPKES